MHKRRKLRILVDDERKVEAKGAFPFDGIDNAAQKTIEIGVDSLQKNIQNTLNSIFALLSKATLQNDQFEVEHVVFSLCFDTKGEVSLVSVASGSITTQTGIQFTLSHRETDRIKNNEKSP